MSSIGNMPVSNLQPATGAPQRIGGTDADGDNDGSAGQAGRASFLNLIEQALGKSMASNAPSSATTSDAAHTDPQAALQSFLHSLMASLQGGQNLVTSTADQDESASTASKGAQMSANLQDLLQQLSASSSPNLNQGTETLSKQNSNFQNMLGSLSGHMPQSTQTGAATLQGFLQNLYQDMGSNKNASGSTLNDKA